VTAILPSFTGRVGIAGRLWKSKSLDFAVTLFLIHLGLCTVYGLSTVLDLGGASYWNHPHGVLEYLCSLGTW
jgi:hypothetical protein